MTASYAVRNHLVEVAPILGADLKNFSKAATDQGNVKGKLWSVPYATSEILLYYNVDILKAAGIEPPRWIPSKRLTWEKLYELAKKANDPAKGIYGLVIEQADRPYQILAMPELKGAKVISDDGLTTKGFIDSPKFIEAIQFYQKVLHREAQPGWPGQQRCPGSLWPGQGRFLPGWHLLVQYAQNPLHRLEIWRCAAPLV